MKKSIVAVAVVMLATLLVGSSPAGAASQSAEVRPLNIKIVSINGRPKLQVARKLTAVMSCSGLPGVGAIHPADAGRDASERRCPESL